MILKNKYSKWTVLHPVYATQDVEIHYHMEDKWRSAWICEMIIYVLQMNNEIAFFHPQAWVGTISHELKLHISIILFNFSSNTLFLLFLRILVIINVSFIYHRKQKRS